MRPAVCKRLILRSGNFQKSSQETTARNADAHQTTQPHNRTLRCDTSTYFQLTPFSMRNHLPNIFLHESSPFARHFNDIPHDLHPMHKDSSMTYNPPLTSRVRPHHHHHTPTFLHFAYTPFITLLLCVLLAE